MSARKPRYLFITKPLQQQPILSRYTYVNQSQALGTNIHSYIHPILKETPVQIQKSNHKTQAQIHLNTRVSTNRQNPVHDSTLNPFNKNHHHHPLPSLPFPPTSTPLYLPYESKAKHLSTLSALFPHQFGIKILFPALKHKNTTSAFKLYPLSNAAARI